jgi:hypothetical protein
MFAKTFHIVVMAVFCGGVIALGGEYPSPVVPADFPNHQLVAVVERAGWFWSFLASPEAAAGILGIVSFVAGLVLRRRWVAKWRLERAIQCLASGVRETYEEYVRIAQKANADGKLTTDERDRAMGMAIEKAKSYARDQGFDLAKAYAKEYLPVVVERLIGVQKANGRGFPFEYLLPDLEPLPPRR